MHQSFVVPALTGNSGAFDFTVFKALLNVLHCWDKFMVKSLRKAPPLGASLLSVAKINLYLFHSKRSGLLDTASIIDSMTQVIRKLKFEVDVALIYVCKASWRKIDTLTHLRHCRTHRKLNRDT